MRISQGESQFNLDDLAQDVYVVLLNKGEDFVKELYDKGELNFYLSKILIHQLNSTTSPYYTLYKKNTNYEEL